MQVHPRIIQGGMGIAISQWQLARAVSTQGELGVVSGTGIGVVLARRLQRGDPDGNMRRALAHFPVPSIAERVVHAYFLPDGLPAGKPYKSVPFFTLHPRRDLLELVMCANFAEVWLAKEGHSGLVGINLLEKVQFPHLVSLYGAMLAGVDAVLMGAGIPVQIPGILDALAQHALATYHLHVDGAAPHETYPITFDPQQFLVEPQPPLTRPEFFAIISSATLAKMLVQKSSGRVNGFVVEAPTAGGHNAPPRGAMQRNIRGEPLYGERDRVDFSALRELGLPFWLGGSFAHPRKLQEALALGAAGIQAGTIFALSAESGFAASIKHTVLHQAQQGTLDIFTDPVASPTGYPFKVAQLPETLADPALLALRPRRCDIGGLRQPYKRADGIIGYRCPAEPIPAYLVKGGKETDTEGRVCLCNALLASADLPQLQRHGYQEMPLVTLGDDLSFLDDLQPPDGAFYSAAEAVTFLREGLNPTRSICEPLRAACPQ